MHINNINTFKMTITQLKRSFVRDGFIGYRFHYKLNTYKISESLTLFHVSNSPASPSSVSCRDLFATTEGHAELDKTGLPQKLAERSNVLSSEIKRPADNNGTNC